MPLVSIANSCKFYRELFLYLSIIISISSYFSSESFSSDKIIAMVGGEEIKLNEVEILMKNLSGQALSLPKDQLRQIVLKQLINNKIIANLARTKNYNKSIEFQVLKSISEERMLHDIYIKEEINKRLNKKLLDQKYNNFVIEFSDKVEVRARHILLSSKEDAFRVINNLKLGESFSDLAKKNSIGPSANLGGDLGYFSKDVMVKEFAEAVFSLKIGEVSSPVKTKFGWHVIKLIDKRKIYPPKLEEVQEKLIENLKEELYQEIIFTGKRKYKVIIIDKEKFAYD